MLLPSVPGTDLEAMWKIKDSKKHGCLLYPEKAKMETLWHN